MALKKKKSKNFINGKFVVVSFLMLLLLLFVLLPLADRKTDKEDTQVRKNKPTLPQTELAFISEGNQIEQLLLVEIAADDYTRAFGLMFRESLPENQGMLFIFKNEELQSFWMKNTPISLDIIFVNENKEIVKVHKYTEPYSTRSYPSIQPAKYVVETVAGYCDRYGISEGYYVNWDQESHVNIEE